MRVSKLSLESNASLKPVMTSGPFRYFNSASSKITCVHKLSSVRNSFTSETKYKSFSKFQNSLKSPHFKVINFKLSWKWDV